MLVHRAAMRPAQEHQIVELGLDAVGAMHQVMRLEVTAAIAARMASSVVAGAQAIGLGRLGFCMQRATRRPRVFKYVRPFSGETPDGLGMKPQSVSRLSSAWAEVHEPMIQGVPLLHDQAEKYRTHPKVKRGGPFWKPFGAKPFALHSYFPPTLFLLIVPCQIQPSNIGSVVDDNRASACQFGEWIIDADLNRIRREGEERQLEPRTMEVLQYFVERPGQVVSFDELLDEFWRGRVVNEGTIHRRIRQIRRILDDDAKAPRYLETIRKRGYRTVAPVRRLPSPSGDDELKAALESQTPPFPAYEGGDPYVFVCYAHDDRARVYPELIRLRDRGTNIWYDEGISPGSEWTEELAKAIGGCSHFLYFISPASVASGNCRDEVQYAREAGKNIIAIYLDETELPEGLRLEIGRIQAILRHSLSKQDYARKLEAALGERAPLPPASARRVELPPAGRRDRHYALVGALVLGVALLGWLIGRWVDPEKPSPTVAVLPFANMTGNRELEYFAEGISVEVLSRLSESDELAVISRPSSFWYKDKELPLDEIARSLRADFIVEGSLRESNGVVRVAVQLVDARNGTHAWSRSFDNAPDAAFEFQESVAQSVADALAVELRPANPDQGNSDGAIVAYDSFLLGKNLLDREDQYGDKLVGRDAVDRARTHLERAVELDPELAVARLQLARTYLRDRNFKEPVTWKNAKVTKDSVSSGFGTTLALTEEGRTTVERMLRPTDDVHAEYHLIRAELAHRLPATDESNRAVDEHLRRALEIDPNNVVAMSRLGKLESTTVAEKLELLEQAHYLDPINAATVETLGKTLRQEGRNAEAKSFVLEAYALNPDYYDGSIGILMMIAESYLEEGRYDVALAWLHRSRDRHGNMPVFSMFMSSAYLELGEFDRAEEMLHAFDDNEDPALREFIDNFETSGLFRVFQLDARIRRNGIAAVAEEIRAARATPEEMRGFTRADFVDRLMDLMPASQYLSDPGWQREFVELVHRVVPRDPASPPCARWFGLAHVCLNEADRDCAQANVDEAIEACPVEDWDLRGLSIANEVYPGRFEAELAEGIAAHEPKGDARILYENQFLVSRADYRDRISERADRVAGMRERYLASLESGAWESLLFPD